MCISSASGIALRLTRSWWVCLDECVHPMELGKPVGRSAFRRWFPVLLALGALSRGVEAAHGAIQVVHGDSPSFESVTLRAPGSGMRSPVAEFAPEPEPGGLASRSGILVLPAREPGAGDGRGAPFPRADGPAARVTPVEAVVAVAATLVVLALRRSRRRPIAA